MKKISFIVTLLLTYSLSTTVMPQRDRRRAGDNRSPWETPGRSILGLDWGPFGPRNFEELVDASVLIVRGTVTDIQPTYPNDSASYLVTPIVLSVSDSLKDEEGITDSQIIVRQLGGTYRGHTQTVHGQPPFLKGDEYILFLRKLPTDKEDIYEPIRLSVGRFQIKDEKVYPEIRTGLIGQPHMGKDVVLFIREIRSILGEGER